ncbi:MAG: hypothetical protein NT133_13685 [Alphaproteobacteria bacterium]|nr:hypothetical protein [Alphaproteobacteria bacterium]
MRATSIAFPTVRASAQNAGSAKIAAERSACANARATRRRCRCPAPIEANRPRNPAIRRDTAQSTIRTRRSTRRRKIS